MTGIFLFFLSVFWSIFSLAVSLLVAGRFKNRFLKVSSSFLVLAVLLPLPMIDEIVGQQQFQKLCKDDTALKIDTQKIRGQKIKLDFEPLNAAVPGIAVPVIYTRVIFRNADTAEVLGSYGRYLAKGGWLIRSLGLSEGNSALWINPDYCSPNVGSKQLATQYEFVITN